MSYFVILLTTTLSLPAFAQPSVQIGPPPVSISTTEVSTSTWHNPLEQRVTVKMVKRPLGAFLGEIARQARLRFIFVSGVEKCMVTAFLRDLTVRQAMQATIELQGITYSQLGRSDTYTIAPRRNGPVCPQAEVPHSGHDCIAKNGAPISLGCKRGSLSSFAEILFDQSPSSFFFTDGVEDYPITTQLKGAQIEDAIKEFARLDSVKVVRQPVSGTFIISSSKMLTTGISLSTSTGVTETIGIPMPSPPYKREEAPANPDFKGQ